MLVRELADIIHENAVAHGWWDEERAATEIVALIHSEWSEALEEGRKGAPMAYIEVVQDWQGYRVDVRIERGEDGRYVGEDGTVYTGRYKPEGIAVELIDGCIRILDWLGCAGCDKIEDATGHDMTVEALWQIDAVKKGTPDDLSTLICALHMATAKSLENDDNDDETASWLISAMCFALTWVKGHGLNPLDILMEKHEYNKKRPYKHGKKF